MKKFKLLFSVMLSVVLMITISPVAYADDYEISVCEDVVELETYLTDDSMMSARYYCQYCDNFAKLKCRGEKLMYDSVPHLFGTCTVFYYWSTSVHKCEWCGRELYDYGYHDCEQIHVGCSAGTVNVCPVAGDIS